jgi:hypothetical protein
MLYTCLSANWSKELLGSETMVCELTSKIQFMLLSPPCSNVRIEKCFQFHVKGPVHGGFICVCTVCKLEEGHVYASPSYVVDGVRDMCELILCPKVE